MNFEKQAGFLGTWGWRIIRGSLVWLLGNFIYAFLILNILLAENIDEVGTLVVTAVVLLPFVFSPGTTAAFSCVRKMYNEADNRSLIKVYKDSYKENYRAACTAGLIYSVGLFLLYACYWYYGQLAALGYIVPLILMVVLTVVFLFLLMYIADREEKMLDYWKNSAILLLNHPMLALFMGSEVFFVIFFCHYIGALLLFVAPGGVLLIVHHFYNECLRLEARKSIN